MIISLLISLVVISVLAVWIVASSYFVKEGEALPISFWGAFQGFVFLWKGHVMDEEYNVFTTGRDIFPEEEAPPKWNGHVIRKGIVGKKIVSPKGKESTLRKGERLLGGYVFLPWPIFKPFKFKEVLSGGHVWEGKGGALEGFAHGVSLRPELYSSELKGVETSPEKGRIKINLKYLVEIRVFNPYNYIFISPTSSVDTGLTRLDSLITREIFPLLGFDAAFSITNTKTLWYGIKKEDPETWERYKILMENPEPPIVEGLGEKKLIKTTFQSYGIKVSTEGISVVSIDVADAELMRAFNEERKEKLLALAAVVKAGGVREAQAVVMKAITDAAKDLEEGGCSPEEAMRLAYERHGEILAEQKGGFKKIIWQGNGVTLPELVAQAGLGQSLFGSEKQEGKKEGENKKEGYTKEERDKIRRNIISKL